MKTVISPIALIVAVALIIVIPVFSRAQSSPPASGSQAQGEAAKNPATNPGTTQLATGDPLEGGKEALKKGDFAGAQKFFSAYLVDHPWNPEALYFNGDAALELKQYDEAARNYREVIKQQPSAWGAHKNLVIL